MRPSKYKNKPTVVDGIRFASQAEARRDAELQLLARAGEIFALRRQPRYPLIVNGAKVCTYVADWEYVEKPTPGGPTKTICEDKKGVVTPAFRIKFKLAQALHPEIEWRVT
jgi:hypothetical protein